MSGLDDTSWTTRIASGTSDTITATDSFVQYTNSGAKAVTLPSAASVIPGRLYGFTNSNTGAITVTPSAGTIQGGATLTIAAATTTAYKGSIVVSDGISNWILVANF